MVFFSDKVNTSLFSRKIEDKVVSISVDAAGLVTAIIQSSSEIYVATIQGAPNRISDLGHYQLRRIEVFLNEECIIKLFGGSILILPKVRGGGPPIFVEDCKDNPEQLAEIGNLPWFSGLLTGLDLYALKTGNFWVGASSILLGLVRDIFQSCQEGSKYAAKAEEIQALPTEEAKLLSIKNFFDQNLPVDLPKIRNLEEILAKKIQEEGRRDPSHLPQFLNLIATLYQYKDPKQSNALLSVSHELGKVIPAGIALSAASLPLAAKLGAIATILVSVVSAGMALKRYFIKDEDSPMVDAAVEILQTSIERLRRQDEEGFDRVESTLGEMYVGLSEQICGITERIDCIDGRLLYIKNRVDGLHQKIDTSFTQLLGFHFREKKGVVMALVNAGIKEDQAKEHACVFLNWAAQISQEPIFNGVINQSDPPRLALQNRELEFNIGYLNCYLMKHFPSLSSDTICNPLVWSEAAHAYMELRLSTRNFDTAYAEAHQNDFKTMIAVGVSLWEYMRNIQQSTDLFKYLLSNYRSTVKSLQEVIAEKKRLDHPECHFLFRELDDTCALIRAFCQLAFSRSMKTDPYFIFLLKYSSDYPHGLMTSSDIKNYFRDHDIDKFSYLFEVLLETEELLLRAITDKSESIAKKNVSDDSIVVVVTLLKLNAFWDMVYTQEELIPQELQQAKPTHCIDILELCQSNLVFSVKYGLVEQVRSLVEKGTNIDEIDPPLPTKRTPLHYAALFNHAALVEYLLEQGATLKPDKWGKTALDLAKTSAIESLLISHIQKRVPINALIVGKKFQTVCTSTQTLSGKNVYKMHLFESKVVTVEYNALQIWDLNGTCLKRIPKGPHSIIAMTEGSSVVSTISGRSTLYDLSGEALRSVIMAERANEKMIIASANKVMINPNSGGGPISLISTETGKVIASMNINNGTVCNYCPSSGRSAQSLPTYQAFLLAPFSGHPHCLLVQRSTGRTFFDIWDLQTKSVAFSIDTGADIKLSINPIVSVANHHAAIIYPQGNVKVFNITTNEVVHEVASSNSHSGLFGLWNNKLVATSKNQLNNRDYGIWDVESGKQIYSFKNINHGTFQYGFVKDGIVGILNAEKNEVEVYDLDKEQELGAFKASGIITRATIEGEILILTTTQSFSYQNHQLSFYHIRDHEHCLQTIPEGLNFAFERDTLATYNPQTLKVSIQKII